MCKIISQRSNAKEIKNRFSLPFPKEIQHSPNELIYANDFPLTPIITNDSPNIILMNWGLIPSHAKNIEHSRFYRINNQNARIETLQQTRSFRNVTSNRCLIIVDCFYNKNAKKCFQNTEDQIFSLAGLWDTWVDPDDGKITGTYTVITTESSDSMKAIQPEANRMPVILTRREEVSWLRGAHFDLFSDRSKINLH